MAAKPALSLLIFKVAMGVPVASAISASWVSRWVSTPMTASTSSAKLGTGLVLSGRGSWSAPAWMGSPSGISVMSHANGGQASDQANLVGQAGAGNQSGQVVSKARHGRPDLPRATLRSPAPSLAVLHPGAPQQHSQIYQSLYVQSRGALRRDLAKCLRTGRGLRQPNRQGAQRKSRVLPDMINIAARPAEADDRAVPGHWEGDLVIGKANASAIGTLVERTTGYTMLVHLPDGYKPAQVAPALAAKIQTLPAALRGSLTWDQGVEMRDWKQVRMATDMAIYFCDPHAPWQRGTNENTNGLLRQYFPKGTDLSVHIAADLDWVAAELNDRPRKRLAFRKPIEEIKPLLLPRPLGSADPSTTPVTEATSCKRVARWPAGSWSRSVHRGDGTVKTCALCGEPL